MTTKPQKIEGGRFSQAGMRASARIYQLKRLDLTVMEKIITEEMNSELSDLLASERQRCVGEERERIIGYLREDLLMAKEEGKYIDKEHGGDDNDPRVRVNYLLHLLDELSTQAKHNLEQLK